MKNKFLISLMTFIISVAAANAASYKVHVIATEQFNTAQPAQKISVKVLEAAELGNYSLSPKDVLYCDVIKVTDPKRGKRSATFAVRPDHFVKDSETVKISDNFYGKYASRVISKEELKNVDAVKVGKKAALTVGSHFVKGLTTGVTLAEGMIENEEGNRLESGVKKVYKESPLSYVEKGQELEIKTGDSFYLIFKPSKSKNASDISEEVLEEE